MFSERIDRTLLFAVLFASTFATNGGTDEATNKDFVPKHSVPSASSTCDAEGTCTANDLECAVWLAPSTIPGAGMGMFAGTAFREGQDLLPKGDIVIPVVSIEYHHDYGSKLSFLWDEYTWSAESLLMTNEGESVHAAAPGFGAAINCYLDLVNVDETVPTQIDGAAGLHRSRDPGAGAFTDYHDRRAIAKTDILAGQELFASYGEGWFTSREYKMGKVPLIGHQKKADRIIQNFKRLEKLHNNTCPGVIAALRDEFLTGEHTNTSNLMTAIPKTLEEFETAADIGLLNLRKQQTTVTLEWLNRYGSCASNLYVQKSTIPQAGRGAFASRCFAKGDLVAPIPLIHLVNGTVQMEMYNLVKDDYYHLVPDNKTNVVGLQLLLNYCYKHKDSTLLLCPYGVMTSLVNHDPERANVKLQWGDSIRSNHDPNWLNKSLKELNDRHSTVLAMEFIATRDIAEGDEVVMDYGVEWSEAWNRHVQEWIPVDGAEAYSSASELNSNQSLIVPTKKELKEGFYTDNIKIDCHSIYMTEWKSTSSKEEIANVIENTNRDKLVPCEVLDRKENERGEYVYDVLFREKMDTTVYDLPREVFVFEDKMSSTDMHLKNAFRHPIMIPNELFPEQWKDKLIKGRR